MSASIVAAPVQIAAQVKRSVPEQKETFFTWAGRIVSLWPDWLAKPASGTLDFIEETFAPRPLSLKRVTLQIPKPIAQNPKLADCGSLTSLLSSKKAAALAKTLDDLKDKEATIEALVSMIKEARFTDPLFSHPDLDFYALAAVNQKKLSIFEFSTLIYLKSAICDPVKAADIRTVSLFEKDGAISKEAFELIKKTLVTPESIYPELPKANDLPYLDDNELTQWFEAMRGAPISEQRFYVIPDTRNAASFQSVINNIKNRRPVSQEMLSKISISHAVDMEGQFNVFCRLTPLPKQDMSQLYHFPRFLLPQPAVKEEAPKRMIASFSMLQTFLNIKFKYNALAIKPVIGLPIFARRAQSVQNNELEISLPLKGLPLAKTADGYPAPHAEAIYHDGYHITLASGIPQHHRKAFLELAAFVFELDLPAKYKKIQESLYSALIDLEMADYLTNRQTDFVATFADDLEMKFWYQLVHLTMKATVIESLKIVMAEKGEITAEDYVEFEKKALWYDLIASKIPDKIALYINENKESWQREYRISIDSLDRFSQAYQTFRRKKEPPVKVYVESSGLMTTLMQGALWRTKPVVEQLSKTYNFFADYFAACARAG